VRFLTLVILKSINSITKSVPIVDNAIEEISRKLCKGIIIHRNNVKYVLLDYGSFQTIQSETFMSLWFKPSRGEVVNLKNIIPINLAAGDKKCKKKLFIGHKSAHHSMKLNWKLGWIEVEVKTVDHIISKCGIERVDWIKIDVEGAEFEVLCGLKETLGRYKPKLIIEVDHRIFDKFKSFMIEQRYGLIKISPLEVFAAHGFFRKFAYFLCLPF